MISSFQIINFEISIKSEKIVIFFSSFFVVPQNSSIMQLLEKHHETLARLSSILLGIAFPNIVKYNENKGNL